MVPDGRAGRVSGAHVQVEKEGAISHPSDPAVPRRGACRLGAGWGTLPTRGDQKMAARTDDSTAILFIWSMMCTPGQVSFGLSTFATSSTKL